MKNYNDITESILQKYKKKIKQKHIKKLAITSFVCVVLIALNLFLFLPINYGKNISAYTSDAYYALIQKINNAAIKKGQDKYKNNFQRIMASLSSLKANGADSDTGSAPNNSYLGAGDYIETSYLQTENIIEGDLLKRTDKYIFYINTDTKSGEYALKVYTVNGLNSREIVNIPLSDVLPDCFTQKNVVGDKLPELYLDITKEYSHAIIILPDEYDSLEMSYPLLNRKIQTKIILLDISNVYAIKTLEVKALTGSYLSSRMVNGQLVVATTFTPNTDCDFSAKEEYLPYVIDSNDEKSFCPPENVQIPDDGYSLYSIFLSSFKTEDLSINSSVMLMDYNTEMYMSQNNVYFWRTYDKTYQENADVFNAKSTQITQISFSNAFNVECEYIVEGNINDRYSLDEYNGVLRVFTTSRRYYKNANVNEEYYSSKTRTNFFAFDPNGKKIASVYSFAPKGEKIRSVKFNQNKVYVCTAVDFCDPVFEFDLSDLNNIKYVDSGTISGYSVALRNFTDGTLIGIGYGEDSEVLKIEVYKKGERINEKGESEEFIESLNKFEYEYTLYDTDPKSHFIDEKNGLVGIKVYSGQSGQEYILLKWTGSEFKRITDYNLDYDNDYLSYGDIRTVVLLARAFSSETFENSDGQESFAPDASIPSSPEAPPVGDENEREDDKDDDKKTSSRYVYIVDETGIKVIDITSLTE